MHQLLHWNSLWRGHGRHFKRSLHRAQGILTLLRWRSILPVLRVLLFQGVPPTLNVGRHPVRAQAGAAFRVASVTIRRNPSAFGLPRCAVKHAASVACAVRTASVHLEASIRHLGAAQPAGPQSPRLAPCGQCRQQPAQVYRTPRHRLMVPVQQRNKSVRFALG